MASSVPGESRPAAQDESSPGTIGRPRVVIQFCTQCKWMLRAAYFAQELMSTFGLALGEVALQPSTGGVFKVTIETDFQAGASSAPKLLWDRKAEGGFPETKELKRRVRDVIEPGRDLGHVDRHNGATKTAVTLVPEPDSTAAASGEPGSVGGVGSEGQDAPVCEDCK